MRWCVIRHPELGAAIVGEASLPVHEARGWAVTSPLVDDQYALNVADHPMPEPAPDEPASAEPATEPSGDVAAESTPTRPTTKTRSKSTED